MCDESLALAPVATRRGGVNSSLLRAVSGGLRVLGISQPLMDLCADSYYCCAWGMGSNSFFNGRAILQQVLCFLSRYISRPQSALIQPRHPKPRGAGRRLDHPTTSSALTSASRPWTTPPSSLLTLSLEHEPLATLLLVMEHGGIFWRCLPKDGADS